MKPLLSSLTLEEKILQTKVALMKRNEPLTEPVGAAFFFGQIITEAEEAGLDELRGKVRAVNDLGAIPPLITSDFENGCGSAVSLSDITALTELCRSRGVDRRTERIHPIEAVALECADILSEQRETECLLRLENTKSAEREPTEEHPYTCHSGQYSPAVAAACL